jgi:hypothetical protein
MRRRCQPQTENSQLPGRQTCSCIKSWRRRIAEKQQHPQPQTELPCRRREQHQGPDLRSWPSWDCQILANHTNNLSWPRAMHVKARLWRAMEEEAVRPHSICFFLKRRQKNCLIH